MPSVLFTMIQSVVVLTGERTVRCSVYGGRQQAEKADAFTPPGHALAVGGGTRSGLVRGRRTYRSTRTSYIACVLLLLRGLSRAGLG